MFKIELYDKFYFFLKFLKRFSLKFTLIIAECNFFIWYFIQVQSKLFNNEIYLEYMSHKF